MRPFIFIFFVALLEKLGKAPQTCPRGSFFSGYEKRLFTHVYYTSCLLRKPFVKSSRERCQFFQFLYMNGMFTAELLHSCLSLSTLFHTHTSLGVPGVFPTPQLLLIDG